MLPQMSTEPCYLGGTSGEHADVFDPTSSVTYLRTGGRPNRGFDGAHTPGELTAGAGRRTGWRFRHRNNPGRGVQDRMGPNDQPAEKRPIKQYDKLPLSCVTKIRPNGDDGKWLGLDLPRETWPPIEQVKQTLRGYLDAENKAALSRRYIAAEKGKAVEGHTRV